ncbi:hypothetical protein HJFPF1_08438 [Paramyrothecium foliicola]|nr:hypothetical protein HJFPF1_08438 [Paramyrothecium foliicola]
MFLIYQDGSGNVTVSNREERGHNMPLPMGQNTSILLSGSGVKNGRMIAHVRYTHHGNLDPSGPSDRIMATKQGASLGSTDPNESIGIQDSHSIFSVDLAHALIASDTSPFDKTNDDENGNFERPESPSKPVAVLEQDSNPDKSLILAHGLVLNIIFVIISPVGSLFMPMLGRWYIHAGWQMIRFVAMWAGFGAGYIVSRRLEIFFDQARTHIGILSMSLFGIQPLLGFSIIYITVGRENVLTVGLGCS